MKDNLELKNKVILITGGGSGIGKAAALAFVKAQARVVICGRDENKLKNTAREIKTDYFLASVEDEGSAENLIHQVVGKYGTIDVLVNCAGIYGPIGKFNTNGLKLWKEAISINLLGTVNVSYFVLPVMLKQKAGKIINLSGGGAVQPFENFSAYATSKAGVVRFTENLAKEYKSSNIQVNAVAPGAINTKFLDEVLNAGEEKVGSVFFKKSIEQKKSGGDDPSLASELILFLSKPSNRLTGKIISAKWDDWKSWTSEDIEELNNSSALTLRRIDNKYYYEK